MHSQLIASLLTHSYLLRLVLELKLPIQLALLLVRGPVLSLTLNGAVARDEALAAALAWATQFSAADASAEEGRRSMEGIRPPRGDLRRPSVLNEAHEVVLITNEAWGGLQLSRTRALRSLEKVFWKTCGEWESHESCREWSVLCIDRVWGVEVVGGNA